MKLIARLLLFFRKLRHPTWQYRECPNCHWYMELWDFKHPDALWMCDHCNFTAFEMQEGTTIEFSPNGDHEVYTNADIETPDEDKGKISLYSDDFKTWEEIYND